MKTVVFPLLLLVLFVSGAYVYLEMKGVNEVEVEEVGSAGGNMRGAGKDQIKKTVENMKKGYATSIKEKNVFATKELGNGYPESFPLLDILKNWSPDHPKEVPEKLYQSMRHFDYETELEAARKYREAEVPFVIKNVPVINEAVAKWQWDWLQRKIGSVKGRVEKPTGSDGDGAHGNNHLMFWRSGGSDPSGYKPPTSHTSWDFNTWYKIASKQPVSTEDPHYYYHMWGKRNGEGPWIYKTLGQTDKGDSFAKTKSFFVPDPTKNRGILCRFGMEGTIAETHFDMNRNMVSIIRGRKRYIIQAPDQCENVYFYDNSHPSRRHSMVDFSQPDSMDLKKFAKMKKARGFEVILEEGDVLYLPSFWMHYIVGLGQNIQCNTRSGMMRDDPWARKVQPCLA